MNVHKASKFPQNAAMGYHELIDIGVNLTHGRFDVDREAVIQRAMDAGVTRMVLTGVTLTESSEALEMASSHTGVMAATAGVHPHHASEWTAQSTEALTALLAHPNAVAVGETGLDYCRDFSPRSAQRQAFEAQLAIAGESGYPAFLHQRDAEDDFLAILRDYRDQISAAVIHCFTGDRAFLHRCLDLDLHVGVTGWICDERRGSALRESVPDIPDHRLMIETDAPFLLPRDMPEKPADRRNEPAFLPHVLESVARLRGQDPSRLAEFTATNSAAFFSL